MLANIILIYTSTGNNNNTPLAMGQIITTIISTTDHYSNPSCYNSPKYYMCVTLDRQQFKHQ